MKLRRTSYLALAAMLAITLTTLTAHAQESHAAPVDSRDDLNLSSAQVFQIQALLSAQTTEIRSLYLNVQSARETLSEAVAEGDPVRTATAVLSLDAAEKALKITEQANQRKLLSLLNDSQKQVLRDASKSLSVSD